MWIFAGGVLLFIGLMGISSPAYWAFLAGSGGPRARIGAVTGAGGHRVVLVGLLGRSAATAPAPPRTPRAHPPAPSRRSRPVRGIFWRERPTDGETGARAGGRMHILAACGAPARDDHDQERT